MAQTVLDKIVELFNQHGGSQYGGEAVTQREHALQGALLARQAGLDAPAVVAATNRAPVLARWYCMRDTRDSDSQA